MENLDIFPIEINKASYEELIRVPGFGKVYAMRIINARKFSNLTFDDLRTLKISLKRAINFITVGGKFMGVRFSSKENLKNIIRRQEGTDVTQLSLF